MTATTIAIPAERGAARSEWLTLFRRLARRRTALFGLVVVALVFAAALGAPWLSPGDPIEQDITNRLKPPGSPDPSGRVHVLGTDHLGRDLLARVIFGARPALLVGVAAVAISGVIGMLVGLVSGYFGGRTDDVLMRLAGIQDRKSTRLKSSHLVISYAVFCFKKKKKSCAFVVSLAF